IEHGVVAHQPSVQSPRLGLKHVTERTCLPYRRGHGRMTEIGDFDDSPVTPRERMRPPQRMQPRDGQEPPRDRHARRGQAPAEPVERAYSGSATLPGRSMTYWCWLRAMEIRDVDTVTTKQITRRWLFWTIRVSVAIIRRSGCSTKGRSDTSNTVPRQGRDIAAAVSDDAARLR